MLAASILCLALASVPVGWIPIVGGTRWRFAEMRGPLAVMGAAVLFGFGAGYLIVLLQSL
jgi:hypothetical protein